MSVADSTSSVLKIGSLGCIGGCNVGSMHADGNNSSALVNTNLLACSSSTILTIGALLG